MKNVNKHALIFTPLTVGLVLVWFGFAHAAPEHPAACEETDNFIFADDNNTASISGGNGKNCILVGNNNSGNISGGNGKDVIIVGYDNTGSVTGGNGKDTIMIGDGNTGTVDGGNGDDTITAIARVPQPLANPLPGSYTSVQNVILTSEGSPAIRYTTDGTVPSCFSATGNLYTSPISIFFTKTVTAVGCSKEGFASAPATLTYTIEKLQTNSSDLSTLLKTDVFVPKFGTTASSTPEVLVAQNLEINVPVASGTSQVVLNKDTVITRADAQPLDTSLLTSSAIASSSLSGLASGSFFQGALQWGIPDVTLKFSSPITINIFLGANFNSQTFNVGRSVTGIADWTTAGIVPPATCTVADGLCSFQAVEASFYAATTILPTPTPAPTPTPSSTPTPTYNGGGIVFYYPTPSPTPTSTPTPTPTPTPISITTLNTTSTPKPKPLPKVAKLSPSSKMARRRLDMTPTPAADNQFANNQSAKLKSQPSLRQATILGSISHAVVLVMDEIRSLLLGLMGIKFK